MTDALRVPEGAVWIGPAHPFDLRDAYVDFRAEVVLDRVPSQALLHLTADSRYRLWVNGTFAGRGPERCWPSSQAVDARPVAGLLRAGVNRIEVQVFSPGHSHFAHVHRGACGLIGWLTVDGAVVLRTGPHWQARRDRSWRAGTERVSIYGAGVEDRDLRVVPGPDEGWEAPRVVQGPTGPVWHALRPRHTPLPVEDLRGLDTPWQVLHAPCPAPSDDPHADLRAAFAASAGGAGDLVIRVFDLGESRACVAGAEVVAKGGERLLVSYAEKLRGGAVLLPDPATYCRMRPTDRFTLAPGRQVVEGFTPRGARYVIFALEAGVEARFFARLPGYPLEERPLPAFGDPVLEGVAAICARTTRACLQDGFVDGAWREASLWLGDAVAQDWALRALSDDPRPLLFALDMAAEGADATGLLPSVLPGEVPAYAVTDYNFAWVDLLAGCATHPGVADPGAVWRRHWGTLRAVLAAMARHRGRDGLLRNPPGRRLFLDWSAMDRGEPNLTLNLRHLRALQQAAGMAAQLGEAEGWEAEARALAGAILALKTPQGWRECPGGAEASQLALALLILTGLAGDGAPVLADRITAVSLGSAEGPALASPFMHHTLFQALESQGRPADIRRIIAQRWGAWVAEGRVTTPENWSIDFPDGSAAHGFSAHALGWLWHLSLSGFLPVNPPGARG